MRIVPNAKDGFEIYEFGNTIGSTSNMLLSRAGAHIPLTPKVFDTLLLLVRHSGEVLKRKTSSFAPSGQTPTSKRTTSTRTFRLCAVRWVKAAVKIAI